jgi:ATPase subunit of ABC transporter with duplicated ATPase domains
MLTVHSLSKWYGIETVLDNITLTLNAGERLGLIGPNGCGKTTLLRILAGREKDDSGGFQFNTPNIKVGYLPQGLTPANDETIGSFIVRKTGDIEALSTRLEQLSSLLSQGLTKPDLHKQYDQVLAKIQIASENARRAPSMLSALGLGNFPTDTPVSHLSGGQKTRLSLAHVLLSKPQLLLLDEPTNHLDLDMLDWLEDWLVNSPQTRKVAMLIVSHDRIFLDRTVTGILELDPISHKIRVYSGTYNDYVAKKIIERRRQQQAYKDQQEEIARLRLAAARMRGVATKKRGGKGDSGDKFATGFFSD